MRVWSARAETNHFQAMTGAKGTVWEVYSTRYIEKKVTRDAEEETEEEEAGEVKEEEEEAEEEGEEAEEEG